MSGCCRDTLGDRRDVWFDELPHDLHVRLLLLLQRARDQAAQLDCLKPVCFGVALPQPGAHPGDLRLLGEHFGVGCLVLVPALENELLMVVDAVKRGCKRFAIRLKQASSDRVRVRQRAAEPHREYRARLEDRLEHPCMRAQVGRCA